MSKSLKSVTGLTLAAASAAVAVAACGSGASAAKNNDVTVYEKVRGVKTVDVRPRARHGQLSVGDRVLTRQLLFNSGGKRIGTLYTDCTSVGRKAPVFKATLQCTAAYRLSGGSVLASGVGGLQPGARLAITGGTGSHRSASGEVEFAKPAKGYDTVDVLHLDG